MIAPGKEFNWPSINLKDLLASLSVAGKSIFLRTDTHLYRLEKK